MPNNTFIPFLRGAALIIVLLAVPFLGGFSLSAQPAQPGDEIADSIKIVSLVGAYQFDDIGTSLAAEHSLTLIPRPKRKDFIVSEYSTAEITVTIKPKSKRKIIRHFNRFEGRRVSNEKVKFLLRSLRSSEVSERQLDSLALIILPQSNKRLLRELAKRHGVEFRLSSRYEEPDVIKNLVAEFMNRDTLNYYLQGLFRHDVFTVTSDYQNTVDIKVYTSGNVHFFRGSFENPIRQPWGYSGTKKGLTFISVLNLDINQALLNILPQSFQQRKSLKARSLKYGYAKWFLKRRWGFL